MRFLFPLTNYWFALSLFVVSNKSNHKSHSWSQMEPRMGFVFRFSIINKNINHPYFFAMVSTVHQGDGERIIIYLDAIF